MRPSRERARYRDPAWKNSSHRRFRPATLRDPRRQSLRRIWAIGLRNPWRFSFDRSTDDFYLADVGQVQVEEIYFQSAATGAGANYGWNLMEGSRCFDNPGCSSTGLTLPIA